jgi:hypothetical protein
MEREGPLLCSQEPATGPSPEPYPFIPHLSPYYPKILRNIILPITRRSSE